MARYGTEIMTAAEVAALLDCEESTVEAKARDRQLPAVKYGRSWVFPRSAVLEYLHHEALKNTGLPPGSIVEASEASGVVFDMMRGRKPKAPPVLPTL